MWLQAVKDKTAGKSLERTKLEWQWEENEKKILPQFASEEDKWLKLITCFCNPFFYIYTI